MTLNVLSLASGSNGNALLIQSAGATILIDAGIAPQRLAQQLRLRWIEPAALTAICLTHEHSDHAFGAAGLARRFDVPIVCNAATFAALGDPGLPHRLLATGASLELGDLRLESFAVPHDAAAPVGYRVDHWSGSVGVATDLGEWDDAICAALAPADLLLLEANHNLERLALCRYPAHLKQRIRGKRGHLSNVQTASLLASLQRRSARRRTVWLAHLSARSNTPELALADVRNGLHQAGATGFSLDVAPRGRPGPAWAGAQAEQLRLI
ncbi:MAG TPA: MBL fold metallo-hydrolase [Herpetosiphonaceae bacterium]